MDKVFIGKIVNTHGIKGEFRIKSDFDLKARVFVVGKSIIIDDNSYEIRTYRVHKGYDMITLVDFDNINDVLPFKGMNAFVSRESLNLQDDEYLVEDYIGSDVILNSVTIGKVVDYIDGTNSLLEVNGDKHFYIPLKADFIIRFDKHMKVLIVDDSVRGLMLWG